MHAREPGAFLRGFRAVLGLIYFFGSFSHVYFGLANPGAYRDFSDWAPPTSEPARDTWTWFLSDARYLALVLAAFEMLVAVLILYGGRATKLGLLGALGFHVVLALMFGMWPYTLPMIVLLGWSLRYDFDRVFRRPR
jgi:hypothetical protein